jgi:hypothetical protein
MYDNIGEPDRIAAVVTRNNALPPLSIEGPTPDRNVKAGDVEILPHGLAVWNDDGQTRIVYPWHRVYSLMEVFE